MERCTFMFIIRPVIAVILVVASIMLGWVAAWKLVLVHVPLIQEIFGLKKKSQQQQQQQKEPPQPKPAIARLSRLLSDNNLHRVRDRVQYSKEAEG